MNYSHTRDFVAIRPIPSPSHVGLKVTARSSTPVYTCESPSRKEVAKQNYERRDYQTSSCGYRSVNHKPYREVGEVILDERELILRALGQYSGNEKVGILYIVYLFIFIMLKYRLLTELEMQQNQP